RAISQAGESGAQIRWKEAEIGGEERKGAAETQFESQTRTKRQELQQLEDRLKEQERNLQRRVQLLGQKQQEIDDREARVKGREAVLTDREKEAQTLVQGRRLRLERIAGITAVQARRELLRDLESDARQEAAGTVRWLEEEARDGAAARPRSLPGGGIQG